ncbi:MAG TPA: hypothetical protein VLD57_12160 [Blastocatellia bacterium]|nr:hypothetical protein [Blastocatellia bacterium]
MKDRIKWILVGLGFTFGLQVIISLIFTGIALSAARSETGVPQESISVLVIGIALGAFLIGGFIIGWMSEELRIVEALIAAIGAIALSTLIFAALPEGNKGQFLTGLLVGDLTRQPGQSAVFIALALAAAVAGNYLGWHVKVPQEGVLDRAALLIGLIGAVVGPFTLLAMGGRSSDSQPELPWYFLVIVLVLLLVIVGVGFVMFTRESHYDEEISISPETRREQQ